VEFVQHVAKSLQSKRGIYLSKPICQERQIDRINQKTPLIVPSFSSMIDERIGLIHERFRNRIPIASLVSAYDVVYGYIKKDSMWASDVVFIDSGNYEFNNLCNSTRRKNWSLRNYSDFLHTMKPLSKVTIVNFDGKQALEKQVENADKVFSDCTKYAHCFLYRPIRSYVNIDELIHNISMLSHFDVLGFTEKELGSSLVQRCENLIKLRRALRDRDVETPIHIFGCIDPLSVLIFFLSGADIFDGTSWLKFSFDNNLAIYPSNAAIISGSWKDSDSMVFNLMCIENLRKLTQLLYDLKEFSNELDFAKLHFNTTVLERVKNIIATAQSNIGGNYG
jgi:hypothetical protein